VEQVAARCHHLSMANIRTDAADGLTAEAVMHAHPSTLPATATIGEVRDYFAASASRRLGFLVDEEGGFAGSLTPAHVTSGDPARPAAEVADHGTTVAPDESAVTARDVALRTDARRVPVVDGEGRLVGVIAVTRDLQSFCGTG
jgi:Mg/Co/Ni transporter MgtE